MLAILPKFNKDMNIIPGIEWKPIQDSGEGSKYVGEWSTSGKRHGFGIQVWKDGSIYEGHWEDEYA